jgi:hypothetical protein
LFRLIDEGWGPITVLWFSPPPKWSALVWVLEMIDGSCNQSGVQDFIRRWELSSFRHVSVAIMRKPLKFFVVIVVSVIRH